jgi:hypothetical protein
MASRGRTTAVDMIRTQPIPTALVAIGMGWLLASGIRGGKGAAVRRAEEEARRMEWRVERQLDDDPLTFGAVAVAVGAAIGLLLPHSDVEDRVMGETRDQLLDRARQRAQGAADKVMSTVQDKADELTENLKNLDGPSAANGAGAPPRG